jgi:hypothetical protein
VRYGGAGNPPIDLLAHPEHVNQSPELAARILVQGMMEGLFSGAALTDYVSGDEADFTGARWVVNGQYMASEIATTAEAYREVLADAGWAALADDGQITLPDVDTLTLALDRSDGPIPGTGELLVRPTTTTSANGVPLRLTDANGNPTGELPAGAQVTVLTQPQVYGASPGTSNPSQRRVLVGWQDAAGWHTAYVDDSKLNFYADNVTLATAGTYTRPTATSADVGAVRATPTAKTTGSKPISAVDQAGKPLPPIPAGAAVSVWTAPGADGLVLATWTSGGVTYSGLVDGVALGQ